MVNRNKAKRHTYIENIQYTIYSLVVRCTVSPFCAPPARNSAYLEGVARIGMIAMPCTHACLLAHQGGHHFELLTIHIAVTIQIEHAERNLKVTTRNCKRIGRESTMMCRQYYGILTGQHCQQKYVVGEGDESVRAQFIENAILFQM